MAKMSLGTLKGRFERVVCPAMGWTYRDGFSLTAGEYYSIEKAPYPSKWRIVRNNSDDAKRQANVTDPMTKLELMAFMDGLLWAVEKGRV